MRSKVLAISAISAAFIVISLTIGVYVEIADLISLVVASAFVVMPIYLRSYKGSFLAFLVGGVIALLLCFSKFYSIVFPAYVIFFGIYPIVSLWAREKKVKRVIYYIVGIIWSIAFFYGAYFYYTSFLGLDLGEFPSWMQFVTNNILYFICPFAVVFYFVFDRYVNVVKMFYDRILTKVIKS